MLEGTYTPPLYLDLYNFHDGAQNDIFENTTDASPGRRDETHAEERALRRPRDARHRRSEYRYHS